jgi:hypothetical protein
MLRQAVVLAGCITIQHPNTQEKAYSLRLYLEKYGKHLHSTAVLIHGNWQWHTYTGISSAITAGAPNLTRLGCMHGISFNPAILVGQTRLQVLCLGSTVKMEGASCLKQLLAGLQEMEQLTQLELWTFQLGKAPVDGMLDGVEIPAAAYSALTASSNLQHLRLRGCTLPENPWQLLLPDGRQLPHLRSLDISYTRISVPGVAAQRPPFAAAPDSSRLASCCPGLERLDMIDLEWSADATYFPRLLRQLPRLTRLGLKHHEAPKSCTNIWQEWQ